VTVEPLSAVPVKVGATTFVIPSVDDEPLSLSAVMTGLDGAAGATVSMRTSRDEVALVRPAVSFAE
jgi:hypothetical protein